VADQNELWTIEGELDVSKITRELEGVVEDAEQAAAKMADALRDEVEEAAEDAGDALDKMGKEAKKAAKQVEDSTKSAGKSLDKMGGKAGDSASAIGKLKGAVGTFSPELAEVLTLVEDGADAFEGATEATGLLDEAMGGAGLAGSLSSVGAVAGPALVAVAAVGTAFVVVANQTYDARAELALYLGVIRDVDADTRHLIQSQNALRLATGDVEGFMGDLELQTALLRGEISQTDLVVGQLGGALADELAPELRAAGQALAENIVRQEELEAAINSGRLSIQDEAKAWEELQQAWDAEATLQANLDAIKALGDEGRDAINAYGAAITKEAEAQEHAARATRAHTEETARLNKEAAEAARLQAEIAKLTQKYSEEVSRTKFGDAYTDLQLRLDELAEAQERGVLNEQDALLLREQAWDDYHAEISKGEAALEAERRKAHDAELARIAKEETDHLASTQKQLAAAAFVVSSLQSISDAAFEAKMAGMDEESKAYQRYALKQFKVNQALQIASAGVNLAQATLMTMATLGPPVPPNVAGIAGMAFTVGAGAAQITAIAAQEPPKMHDGGLVKRAGPGEVDIRAKEDEYMLTKAQVDNAGGPEALDSLRGGPGLGGTIVLENRLRHRTLDTATFEVMGAGGKVSKATRSLRPSGWANPYARS
jgi:hypothetical protein